jgi:hypothetical protein
MTPTPGSDCDSMCSMLPTEFEITASLSRMMRRSISSGARPPYDQMTLTTGRSMAGKMSLGIRVILNTPRSAIRIAMTATVRGRSRARGTIHIVDYRAACCVLKAEHRAASEDIPTQHAARCTAFSSRGRR